MNKKPVSKKIKELEKKLEECEKEKQEYIEGWQRAKADYLNSRRNDDIRMKEIIKNSNEELILNILPILDNLELAEKNLPENLKENDFVKGVIQIKKQFQDVLKNEGVEEIKSCGENFDPNLHTAVEEIEKKDAESGTIAEEIQKGYTLNGKVIRSSRVKTIK